MIKKGLKIQISGNNIYWEGKKQIDQNLLKTEEIFQTTGCPGCNRPFYNEAPGGEVYNYPGKIPEKDLDAALNLIREAESCI